MFDPLLVPELREMLLEQDGVAMREFCEVLHPAGVAENLEELDDDDIWEVLTHAPLRRQVEIFAFFPLERQRRLVVGADHKRLAGLIEEMAPDDRADLLSELEPAQVESLLPLVAQAERAEIRRLLSYPESSAGSLMTTDYASLPEDVTVREALNLLRLQAPDRETIYYVYIVGEQRVLRGFVSLRKLILAHPERRVGDLMDSDIIFARVTDDQELVAWRMAKYDFIAMPVVDEQDRLVGIITHDDVLDVVQEEATEDAHRQAAIAPLEQSYIATPIPVIVWKRIVWLVVLFGTSCLTAWILKRYEDVSRLYVWLSTFIPLVIASGGNAGSQSATLIIRTLSLNEAKVTQWPLIVGRELLVGLTLGAILAAIGFVPAYFLAESNVHGALVVSATVATVVLLGALVGSMLPVIFKRMGMDPALMSNPLIAALCDVSGVVIFYTLVTLVLT
jgi:magnesium transporter